MSLWALYVPGGVIVLGGALILRWLIRLQREIDEHSEHLTRIRERLARIEGRE